MNILIDMVHPADINFYKNAISLLEKKGHKVTISVLRRGLLPSIIKKEYSNNEIILLGKHRSSFSGKILGIFIRQISFLRLYISRRFDVVSSFGFYPGMLAWIRGSRAVHFHDDKEYKLNFTLSKFFCSRFISLCPTKESKHTRVASTYKELAYLNPLPKDSSSKLFKKLGIQKEKYVYVRDVASISLNYADNTLVDYTSTFDYLKKNGYKIVYDAEFDNLPYKGIINFKGVHTFEDMISIKRYAALIITSGDTVLREGALLGTPTVYTSNRNMSINKQLHKEGLFVIALSPSNLLQITKVLLKKGTKSLLKKKAKKLISSCDNATNIIVEELTK